MPDKKELTNREDLLLLMQKFYEKLLADASISYLFTDIAKIDIKHHLSVLVDFWDSVLFQNNTYRKNAMQPHIDIHRQSPFTNHHFTTWLSYFTTSVDELFIGENANQIKQKAESIATVMKLKTLYNQ
ncbi:MAG TPA: group III truncated hemoglobin [Chitinophagaceae bacterium]|nr:group III truncated hemoglobin [Chitinophagaceae bacterium]